MRVVFMGTGEIGLPVLRALLTDPRHDLVGVVTQPDKPIGRKQILTPPRIKSEAREQGVPVIQPRRLRGSQALESIESWAPDVIVVMAYGQLLPPALLELPKVACLNLHASLLPRHRGAAPIQAAIRDGDARSGITVMHMAEGLDTGDVLLQRGFELDPGETGGSLHDKLALSAPAALSEALDLLSRGEVPRIPQEESQATHVGKLGREDGILDWSQPAPVLERLIRAYDPWPGTLTFVDAGRGPGTRLKIFPPVHAIATGDGAESQGAPGTVLVAEKATLLVATGDGSLELTEVQMEGKRRMSVLEFLQGHAVSSGTRLGQPERSV